MCWQLHHKRLSWNLLSSRCRRQKRMDGEQLLHSEWNRRLGVCSVAAIACTMTLSLAFYVVLPKLFASFANRPVLPLAPPFLAFSLAFVLFFLAAYQMASVAEQIPKSCLLYNFAYCTHSEVVAFCLGWTQLMDWLAIMTVLVHTISDHVNLLFHNVIEENLRMDWLKYETESLLESSAVPSLSYSPHSLDWFSLAVVLVSGAILCCSLRVLVTITVVFLISALFTATSTTVVALLHNIAHLRVNYLDVPMSFNEFNILQLFNSCSCFLIGFLAVECLGFLADETEQPAKVLPSVFKCSARSNFLVTFVALLAFFPFVYRIAFAEDTVLPVVFNSISIFSARYLMNVGSICGLSAALLCSFLPATRLLCAFAQDGLLPSYSSGTPLNHLYGKSGSPRLSVLLVVFCVSLLVVLVPKPWLVLLLPLNLCLRLFSLAVLVFKSNFASDKSSPLVGQPLPPKYNRMRHCGVSSNSNSDCGSQDAEEGGSEFSSGGDVEDEDIHLVERMWKLTTAVNTAHCCSRNEHTEKSGLLAAAAGNPRNHSCCSHNYSSIGSPPPHQHNCLTSPCASSLQIANGSNPHRPRFHIYDTTSVCANLDMAANGCARAYQQENSVNSDKNAFSEAESAEKTAQRFLTSFVILSALVAVAHKILRETDEFVPILAVISILLGLLLSLIIAIQVFRLRVEDNYDFVENNVASEKSSGECRRRRSRWRSLGCLLSIFLLVQMLLHYALLKYLALLCWSFMGLALYATSVCKRTPGSAAKNTAVP